MKGIPIDRKEEILKKYISFFNTKTKRLVFEAMDEYRNHFDDKAFRRWVKTFYKGADPKNLSHEEMNLINLKAIYHLSSSITALKEKSKRKKNENQ